MARHPDRQLGLVKMPHRGTWEAVTQKTIVGSVVCSRLHLQSPIGVSRDRFHRTAMIRWQLSGDSVQLRAVLRAEPPTMKIVFSSDQLRSAQDADSFQLRAMIR